MKKTLVSGIQASGTLHIGNYFGAMRQNIAIGNSGEYESYVFIADYHALTTQKDPIALAQSSFDIACAYIACGLDTNKVKLFRQSSVPEVHELTWILNTVTPMPLLRLAHAYKDRIYKELLSNINLENNTELKIKFLDKNKDLHLNNLIGFFDRRDKAVQELRDTANTYGLTVDEVRPLVELLLNSEEITSKNINVGLFDYPILMAADILIYGADVVPVGQDQKQHIEITRDVAGKFNREWKELFKLPKEYIAEGVATVPGTNGEKMSKSKGNVIPLFGTDAEIKKAVMGIVTDSKTPDEAKNPDANNVYNIHKLFLSKEEDVTLRKRYQDGGLSYKDAKEGLLAMILTFITPLRERYDYLQAHREEVEVILMQGGEAAQARAEATMTLVRKAVGLRN